MKTNLNAWLKDKNNVDEKHSWIHKTLECNDGTTLSVQASQYHYCKPREDFADSYRKVEVWFVTATVPCAWKEYGGDENPYAYIPIELVEEFIDLHGGIKS